MKKVIISTDPGIDDAIALKIALTSNKLDIKAIVASAANVSAHTATKNANFLVKKYGQYQKVLFGATKPLKRKLTTAEDVHGQGGLGKVLIDEKYALEPCDFLLELRNIIMAEKQIDFISLGALTNLAMLFKKYPETVAKIGKIYAMVGTINGKGNITEFAEFNAYCDPEALEYVLSLNIPMVINPMELGLLIPFTQKEFEKHNTEKFDQFMFSILDGAKEVGMEVYPAYDPHSVLQILRPEFYQTKKVDISFSTLAKNRGQFIMTPNSTSKHTYIWPKDLKKLRKEMLGLIFKKHIKTTQVGVLGSINTDYVFQAPTIPAPSETIKGTNFSLQFGGKGANCAVAAARLGAKVNFFGAVGDDAASKAYQNHFEQEKVDIANIKTCKNAFCGASGIFVDKKTNSIITVSGANAAVDLGYLDTIKHNLAKNDIVGLQLEIPAQTVFEAIKFLHGKTTIVFNPSPMQKIPQNILNLCDYIIVNEIEITQLPKYKSVEQMMKLYNEKLILTKGSEGAFFYENGQIKNIPALKVKPVDTTGAGDTFLGAFLTSIANGNALNEALTFANICAGIKCTKLGAQVGMPTLAEYQKFIKKG